MTSWAPIGSYTPGPKRNGSLSSSSRIRVLGCTKREAGSLNPSGNRGLATSLLVSGMAIRDISSVLFVRVIAFAVVRAGALGDLGLAPIVVARRLDDSPFHPDHGCHCI